MIFSVDSTGLNENLLLSGDAQSGSDILRLSGTPDDLTLSDELSFNFYGSDAELTYGVVFSVDIGSIGVAGSVVRLIHSYQTNEVSESYFGISTVTNVMALTDERTALKTEGAEILDVNFAVTDANSRIRCAFDGSLRHSTGNGELIAALFIDDEPNARAMNIVAPTGADSLSPVPLIFASHYPGDTDVHNYKIRIGTESGQVVTNTPYGNGTVGCHLVVSEIRGLP